MTKTPPNFAGAPTVVVDDFAVSLPVTVPIEREREANREARAHWESEMRHVGTETRAPAKLKRCECLSEPRPISEPLSVITVNGAQHDQHAVSCTVADWLQEIEHFLACTKTNTIELGRLLHCAKQRLLYGQWTELWRTGRIPFSKRKGEMLVLIGKSLGDLDAQNSAQLPSAWNTLYYLAQLDRPTLQRLIRDGTIHPRLSLRTAKELVAKFKNHGRNLPKIDVRRRFQSFRAFVLTTVPDWTDEQRKFGYAELVDLVHRLACREPKRPRQDASDESEINPRRCRNVPRAVIIPSLIPLSIL